MAFEPVETGAEGGFFSPVPTRQHPELLDLLQIIPAKWSLVLITTRSL